MRHLASMAALTVCLSLCAVAEAHHSFSAQYDSRNRQKITGLITKVEWRNPHIYFYMDVTGADGKVTPWQLELASVQAMVGRGFTKDKLNVGDTVTVEGFRARDDSPLLDVRSIDRTATGEHLLAGRTIQ